MDIIYNILQSKYSNDNLIINNNNITGNTSSIINLNINNNYFICKFNKYNYVQSINMAFDNEIYFYKNINNILDNYINIPLFHDFYNSNDTKYIIIEKLETNKNINSKIIFEIIDEIIKIHIPFWNKNIDFLNYENNTINILTQIKKEQFEYLNIISKYIDDKLFLFFKNNFINYKINNYKNNSTFIHGSIKIDNICFKYINDISKIYFIDWTYYRKGYGIEDILFFLIFSLNHDEFKKYYFDIINYYFNKINEHVQYNINEYNQNIKKSLHGFILLSVIGLLIVHHFKNNKLENSNLDFLDNYKFILSIILEI